MKATSVHVGKRYICKDQGIILFIDWSCDKYYCNSPQKRYKHYFCFKHYRKLIRV